MALNHVDTSIFQVYNYLIIKYYKVFNYSLKIPIQRMATSFDFSTDCAFSVSRLAFKVSLIAFACSRSALRATLGSTGVVEVVEVDFTSLFFLAIVLSPFRVTDADLLARRRASNRPFWRGRISAGDLPHG